MDWCPDEGRHIEPLHKMQADEAVSRFGMSPLWISCWACFGNGLKAEEMHVLRHADPRDVQELLDIWMAEQRAVGGAPAMFKRDMFPPGPKSFAHDLTQMAEAVWKRPDALKRGLSEITKQQPVQAMLGGLGWTPS